MAFVDFSKLKGLPTMRNSFLLFIAPLTIYPIFLILCTIPWVQRQAVYAHKLNTLFWDDLDDPEAWGFGKNQVTPLELETPDGQKLYAWHILPRALYAKHEDELLKTDTKNVTNFKETLSYKLLSETPNSKLIINFHGNSGHLLQNQRPYVYRSFSTLSPETHVLAFDYRGFGRSTGEPTEPGLIIDGVTVVNYALNYLGIPANRIALVGQSLGTAVLSGTFEYFAGKDGDITSTGDFATVMLVSGFRDLKNLLLKYRMGGLIPVLSPLSMFPRIQNALVGTLAESWESNRRLKEAVIQAIEDEKLGKQRHLNIQLMHAFDDPDIPYEGTEFMYTDLLEAARSVIGAENKGVNIGSVETGGIKRSASWAGIDISLRLVKRGGHNLIPTDTPVAVALTNALNLTT